MKVIISESSDQYMVSQQAETLLEASMITRLVSNKTKRIECYATVESNGQFNLYFEVGKRRDATSLMGKNS